MEITTADSWCSIHSRMVLEFFPGCPVSASPFIATIRSCARGLRGLSAPAISKTSSDAAATLSVAAASWLLINSGVCQSDECHHCKSSLAP